MTYNILNGHAPFSYLSDPSCPLHSQNAGLLCVPKFKTKSAGCRILCYCALFPWRNLPADITQSDSGDVLKLLATDSFFWLFQVFYLLPSLRQVVSVSNPLYTQHVWVWSMLSCCRDYCKVSENHCISLTLCLFASWSIWTAKLCASLFLLLPISSFHARFLYWIICFAGTSFFSPGWQCPISRWFLIWIIVLKKFQSFHCLCLSLLCVHFVLIPLSLSPCICSIPSSIV